MRRARPKAELLCGLRGHTGSQERRADDDDRHVALLD